MEDILFNRVPILSVNFFKSTNSEIITNIRGSIATWYYALRNIAIILSLAVLIYIGIRMAISTISEDKAKYKKMLVDWIVGFITIFLLHYIIVITVNVNDLLVGMFSNSVNSTFDFGSFAEQLALNTLPGQKWTVAFTCTILYLFLVVLIFMFLINYLKRMLTVAFLMIIAPIITVTYSIDRVGDRKSTSFKYLAKRIYI